jgi:Sec-independent protein translocase protein TatA
LGGRGRWISEFKASLVYKVSSRTVRAAQRNLVSKKNKPNQTKTTTTTKRKTPKQQQQHQQSQKIITVRIDMLYGST